MRLKIVPLALRLALLAALLVLSIAGPAGATAFAHDATSGFVPATVTRDVIPALTTATVDKTLHIPVVLARVDLVIAVDTTGSMTGELANLKASINAMIDALVAAGASDLAMAVVSFEDYPTAYVDVAGSNCGYSATYGSAVAGDLPYRVNQTVSTSLVPGGAVQTAVSNLVNRSGADGPQDYARVLWEVAQGTAVPPAPALGIGGQPALSYRSGAQKILILFDDNVPHACDLNGPAAGVTSTGRDPGRDGIVNNADDLDIFGQAIPAMNAAGVSLVNIHSGGAKTLWDIYCGLLTAGCSNTLINPDGSIPGGISLAQLVLNQIAAISLDVSIARSCPVGADVRFNRGAVTNATSLTIPNVTPGSDISFTETLSLAGFTPPSTTRTCTVTATAAVPGGTPQVIGTETVNIHAILLRVGIDVKPNSFPNSISLKNQGNVPVALLGSATFDANAVQDPSVRFRAGDCASLTPANFGLGAQDANGGTPENVNGDAFLDRLYHFLTPDLPAPAPGNMTDATTVAHLNGFTTAGVPFCGQDSVRTNPPD